MIVDCHTHVGEAEHYSESFVHDARQAWGPDIRLGCSLQEHHDAQAEVDATIVLAFDAPAAGMVVPSDYVADYVAKHPGKLIGFGSVDPQRPDAIAELQRFRALGLQGLKLGPIYQNFDPLSPDAFRLYAAAEAAGLPIMWHQGTTFVRRAPLAYARPLQLDEVARAFPELRIVIAHLGHPWIDEALVVVRKHPHLYTDVSALASRPWQLYNALVAADEYRVTDRLLFGTDFPFGSFEQTARALRTVNELTSGTGLPRIPEELPEAIIHRDTLSLLGLTTAARDDG